MKAPRPLVALALVLTVLVLVIVLFLTPLFRRNTPAATAPASQAEADGFEVVVYDVDPAGIVANVRSLPLRRARDACAAGSVARLPTDPATLASIERAIPTGKSGGDSRAALTFKPLDGTRQQVRLEFHQSLRTHVYEYTVDGPDLTPTASGYRDLNTSREVRYAPQ
jgi:hypothetical protein